MAGFGVLPHLNEVTDFPRGPVIRWQTVSNPAVWDSETKREAVQVLDAQQRVSGESSCATTWRQCRFVAITDLHPATTQQGTATAVAMASSVGL